MKEVKTEVVFILDRSGSMTGLEEDTIGGFNSTLKKQKELGDNCKVSTVLFDTRFDVIHNRLPIQEVPSLTKEDYYTRGATALLDAVGRSISKIRRVYAETLKENRPEKVLFVITTDGLENSSQEYSYNKIKQMISEVKEKYHWEFLFLGANFDAVKEAERFGIHQDHAVRYHSDKKGTRNNYESISEAITSVRKSRVITKGWKKRVEEDYNKRDFSS